MDYRAVHQDGRVVEATGLPPDHGQFIGSVLLQGGRWDEWVFMADGVVFSPIPFLARGIVVNVRKPGPVADWAPVVFGLGDGPSEVERLLFTGRS